MDAHRLLLASFSFYHEILIFVIKNESNVDNVNVCFGWKQCAHNTITIEVKWVDKVGT